VKNQRLAARALLVALLLAGLAWRLNNIGFGLPSLYDPDEPIFMIKALELLQKGTLNPGWFGHPGSTTIYLLALIDLSVILAGLASGRFASVEGFAAAAYADPGMLFVPSRVAMAIAGIACVGLTYLIGRRLMGPACGLVAAALLAFNPLHIAWSQVVRTDIMASLFMLGCILFAIAAAQSGRWKDYVLAGAFTGLAVATKWPAVAVFVAVAGAAVQRTLEGHGAVRQMRRLAASGLAVLGATFLASPYIFLDWRTVLANVTGEMRPGHLGHTGGTFAENLAWYLQHQVAGSMGWPGLALAVAGAAIIGRKSLVGRWTLLPVVAAFFAIICSQNLVWSRWILPVLPLLCLFAAAAVVAVGRWAAARWNVHQAGAVTALAAAALLPAVDGAIAQSAERANDTRARAAAWAAANIPPGSRVVIEHLELSLRDQPWTILFPVGEAGCIDGKQALSGGVRYDEVQRLRRGSPIVDLGNVGAGRIDTCRADFAILTYYDLYLAESDQYRDEIQSYDKALAGGRTVFLATPRRRHSGGPVARIVSIP
jgi:hypothetical protein